MHLDRYALHIKISDRANLQTDDPWIETFTIMDIFDLQSRIGFNEQIGAQNSRQCLVVEFSQVATTPAHDTRPDRATL